MQGLLILEVQDNTELLVYGFFPRLQVLFRSRFAVRIRTGLLIRFASVSDARTRAALAKPSVRENARFHMLRNAAIPFLPGHVGQRLRLESCGNQEHRDQESHDLNLSRFPLIE